MLHKKTVFSALLALLAFAAAAGETVFLAEDGFIQFIRKDVASYAARHQEKQCMLLSSRTKAETVLEISVRPPQKGYIGVPYAARGIFILVHEKNPAENITAKEAEEFSQNRFTMWKKVNVPLKTVYFVKGAVPVFGFSPAGTRGPLPVIVQNPDDAANWLRRDFTSAAVFPLTAARFNYPETHLLAVDGVKPTPETVLAGKYKAAKIYYLSVKKDAPPEIKAIYSKLNSPEMRRALIAAGIIPITGKQ